MSASSIFTFIRECIPGREMIKDLAGPNESDYSNKRYQVTMGNIDSVESQPSQIQTDDLHCSVTLFYKVNNQKDFEESLDSAQSIRLKVANHLLAKKHGITQVEVGSLIPNIEGNSPMQRTFEFTVRARMSFGLM